MIQNMTAIVGQGEMSVRIREYCWSATVLGPAAEWSATLLAMLNVALGSPMPTAIFWGPEMLILYNDAYRDVLGARHPEALGQPAYQVWEEVWPEVGSRVERTLLSGEPTSAERVLIPMVRGGRKQNLYWNYTLSPVFDGERIAGVFNLTQNVTHETEMMNALVESDERLRMALSVSHCVGMWDWHIQTDLVYAEEGFAALYGADPRKSAAGEPISTFLARIHGDDQAEVLKAIAHTISTGEDYLAEYRLLQRNGTVRWVEARGRCIYAEDGQPLRFPGVTIDVTDRRVGSASPLSKVACREAVAEPEQRQLELPGGVEVSPATREELLVLLQTMLETASSPAEGAKVTLTLDPALAREILALVEEGMLLDSEFAAGAVTDPMALAEAALRVQEQMKRSRGLHLVNSSGPDARTQRYLGHVLHAVWSVLGETLKSFPTHEADVAAAMGLAEADGTRK